MSRHLQPQTLIDTKDLFMFSRDIAYDLSIVAKAAHHMNIQYNDMFIKL